MGKEGKVYAVDIAPAFVEHILKTCAEEELEQVEGFVGPDKELVELAGIWIRHHRVPKTGPAVAVY